MSPHVLEIRLMGGEHNDKKTFIPRISISPSAEQVAFAMKLGNSQFISHSQ
jgi:hypothetical protein